jgi:hypothetical protein
MNPIFTRGEYWLLETVVGMPVPICWLNWDGMEEALNKKGHGMDRALLVKTMVKLFKDGLILAHEHDNWDDSKVLTFKQIQDALDEDTNKRYLFYNLTTKGGKYWEAFALPNWDNYIYDCYESIDGSEKEICTLISPQKDHLVTILNSLRYHEYEIENDSIKWDIVKPWQATYWKKLSLGHRVSFVFEHKDKDCGQPERLNRCWYDMLWYQWR